MSFIKRNSDYVFTFMTEFIVLLAGVLVYKFAAGLEGENDFSEYAIVRRTISFIIPLFIVGLGVGVPRYIAFEKDNKQNQGSYFVAALFLVLIISVPSVIVINVFKSSFAYLFFGDQSFDYLIVHVCIMVLGMLFHALSYGYFRGKSEMKQANLLQLFNLGLAPLLVFFVVNNVLDVIFYTGLIWCAISFLSILYIVTKAGWEKCTVKLQMKTLLIYGALRVPGDFALAGFLAIPAYFTAHLINDDLKTAGYVAFAMSLFNMAGAAFGPICLILLPKASIIIKEKNFELLKTYFKKIVVWTFGLTLLGVLFIEVFANQIIEIYLGDIFLEVVYSVRIVMFATFGYTIYISLRSILDAYYVKAVNTKNIMISFVLFIALTVSSYIGIGTDYIYMLYCFVLAMTVLGILTYIETRKIMRIHQIKNNK